MEHLTNAVRLAVGGSNWYAALSLALTLPDICGGLESPKKTSRARYVEWCNSYLVPRYTLRVGADGRERVFLHGKDCYALRCAVLHEGSDIVGHSASEALDSFLLVAPRDGWTVHCNQSGTKLLLQVDLFCEDICKGVDEWLKVVPQSNPAVLVGIERLMKVGSLEGDWSF